MDVDSSYNLEIRMLASNTRARWFSLSKVVDADITNFKDLVDDVVRLCSGHYGEVVKVFYFCMDTKTNIPVCSDQDLLNMFAKHKASKCCLLTFCYHTPGSDPPEIPDWDFSNTGPSVQTPCTPSVPCPSIEKTSLDTQTQPEQHDSMPNPEPSIEHVGVDEEGLYIEIAPEHLNPSIPHGQAESTQSDTWSGTGTDDENLSNADDESSSDADDEVEDIDDMVKDREPEKIADANYDKKDPPMTVGTVYSDMDTFKMALATHAVKHEFQYNIEKSDLERYRVYCSAKEDGCKWRIHASTPKGGLAVTVKKNPFPHNCQSKRRSGVCVGATQYWVAEQVIDWLKEDPKLGPSDLQSKLKEKHKVEVPYMRCYYGKQLAMDKIYGPWDKSFDNLYRFKAQIEETSPGSIVVIDHHTINNKIRFNRLFFALKPCVDGFLRGCRPYLAVDSTFLTGRFRGQLCVAAAVDGHNWMYPVAVGVIDSETNENWVWFMERKPVLDQFFLLVHFANFCFHCTGLVACLQSCME